jgi:hypothetical protein
VCHARHRTTCPAPARKAFPGPRAIGASRSELLAKRQNWPICEDGSTSLARASVAPESAICSLASCCRSSALPSRAALPGQSRGPADNPGMHDRTGGAHQAGNTATSGLSVAVRETADGAHRPSQGPNPVRHASVDTATPRSTATQGDTPGTLKTARQPRAFAAGCDPGLLPAMAPDGQAHRRNAGRPCPSGRSGVEVMLVPRQRRLRPAMKPSGSRDAELVDKAPPRRPIARSTGVVLIIRRRAHGWPALRAPDGAA